VLKVGALGIVLIEPQSAGLRRIYVSLLSQCFPTLANFAGQQTRANKNKEPSRGGHIVAIKNIVIPLEDEYLKKAARERGISRSKLVRFVMEKVVSDELVPAILGEGDLSNVEPSPEKYRRFRQRA
jgi:hypothetical protein